MIRYQGSRVWDDRASIAAKLIGTGLTWIDSFNLLTFGGLRTGNEKGDMDIDVQSYRQVWHHKERADHLAWIFSLSTSDLVRIIEEPGRVRFFYRPTTSSQSLVDSGKPWKLTGAETLFVVINPNARIRMSRSWTLEGLNPF